MATATAKIANRIPAVMKIIDHTSSVVLNIQAPSAIGATEKNVIPTARLSINPDPSAVLNKFAPQL